jgi:capsule polysaccharide export protein KpsE/RkpR
MPAKSTPSESGWRQEFPLLGVLWENRHLIGRVTAAGLILTLLIALLLPNRYQSSVRLMPPDKGSNTSLALMAAASQFVSSAPGAPALTGMAANMLGGSRSGALFVGVLGSRTVQDAIINQFDLRRIYSDKTYKQARDDLAANTDISEDRKSGIIALRVTDSDPSRAAAIAKAYVEQLNHLVVTLDTSSAHRERVFLEQRLKGIKEDLDSATKALGEFSSKNVAFDPKDQGKSMLDATAQLEAELIARKSELEGLEQIYAPSNFRVRTARARVESLQAELNKLGGTSATASNSTGDNANFRYPSIKQLPLLATTYADLYRRARVQEAVFEILTKQYELAKIDEAKEIPSVKVLDSPDVPERKTSPHRFILTLVGTILSCLCAGVFVIARDAWKRMPSDHAGKMMLQDIVSTSRPFWATTLRWSSWPSRAMRALRERRRRAAGENGQDGNNHDAG